MIPFRLSKAGWRVIEGAVEGGWGQTVRLVFVMLAFAVLLVTALIFAGAFGGLVVDAAASRFA